MGRDQDNALIGCVGQQWRAFAVKMASAPQYFIPKGALTRSPHLVFGAVLKREPYHSLSFPLQALTLFQCDHV